MTQHHDITLRPARAFAFVKCIPLMLTALLFLLPAWWLFPFFILFGLLSAAMACYRFVFIRNCRYLITPEVIRINRGLFFKRTDQVEMYRIKDYIITQPVLLQLLHLMDLTLKTTDPESPVIRLRGIPESEIIGTIRAYVQDARQHNRIYEIN